MAEIKIEKKKTIWPWVTLGAVIVALLLYFFVFNNKKESVAENTNTPAAANLINVHENNATVTEYVSFIQGDSNNKWEWITNSPARLF